MIVHRKPPYTAFLRRGPVSVTTIVGGAIGAWFVIGALITGCNRRDNTSSPVPTARKAVEQAREQTSDTCMGCHLEIHKAWSASDHAMANRPVDARDRAAFTKEKVIEDGGSRFELEWEKDQAAMNELRDGATARRHPVEFILGFKPLWQPLLPAEGGRWQPTDLAFDPAKQEWFNAFGSEKRQPGEWGHWSGRGMNWNSMCAHCHMTGFQKNYSATTDSYQSTWVEHGVGCIQCHGTIAADHHLLIPGAPRASTAPATELFRGDRAFMMHTCASCHARNELLTANFQPGDNYHDHYRVVLPVDPTIFYPDGQQRDEVFNWTSVLLSRMGHAGVTCMDCHDPHTNKTIFPATDNNLCMQCHSAPGRVLANGTRAISIDPLAHSHHEENSAGNSCVACHMPTTNYMQRARRHDHGWLKPDPLLTKELGIPNACNSCHTDKTVEWSIDYTDKWYGTKMDSHQRARTRAIAAAQTRLPTAADLLLTVFQKEDVPAWRATLLDLAAPYLDTSPQIAKIARESLTANDPLERAAAVRLLAGGSATEPLLSSLLRDPVRLVRLDAAWALSPTLAPDSPERAELDAYLALAQDQPSGRLRSGEDLANRGRLPEAEKEMKLAVTWDPHSPRIRDSLGFVLNARGQSLAAAEQFIQSAKLNPAYAQPAYHAALAYADAGRLRDAESALRLTIEREPHFDRAWYNLGLLLAQAERFTEAAEALKTAGAVAPRSADYPYALATVLLRAGNRDGAVTAARRALEIDPRHPGALELLKRMTSDVGKPQ